MAPEEISEFIRADVPKQYWLDTVADIGARFAAAHLLISGTDLTLRRARRIEGQYRYVSVEQGVETIGLAHGGENLQNQTVPGSDALIYQPFIRFGDVVVGFAMHAEPGALPTKNKTRGATAELNFAFMDTLELDTPSSKPLLYVALLASRDRSVAGTVRQIEIAVIDSAFDHFIFRQPIERFIASYPAAGSSTAAAPTAPSPTSSTPAAAPLVKLKPQPKPFASGTSSAKKGG